MSNPISTQIRIRDASEADINFIFNSWLRCYRSSRNTEAVQNQIFFSGHHKVVEGLLKNNRVIIACNPEDPAQIYGYICAEHREGVPVIHMVYVKESYRKLGVAKLLVKESGIELDKPLFYTHRTLGSDKYQTRFNIIFHPYLAYYAYEKANEQSTEAES